MSYTPNDLQIEVATTLLIENDHEIVKVVISEECGYQIETKNNRTKKNPTYKIENGILKKFETENRLWQWVNYKKLPLKEMREEFIEQGYELLKKTQK